jgi:hypothetical protein
VSVISASRVSSLTGDVKSGCTVDEEDRIGVDVAEGRMLSIAAVVSSRDISELECVVGESSRTTVGNNFQVAVKTLFGGGEDIVSFLN